MATAAVALEEPATEPLECAICFDDIPAASIVKLPCECTTAYCHQCWDRSLSASVEQTECSRPQCPTCRSPFLVELHPEGRVVDGTKFARLVFKPAEDTDDKPYWLRWRIRLYQQAKPLQVEILNKWAPCLPVPAFLASLDQCRAPRGVKGDAGGTATPSTTTQSSSGDASMPADTELQPTPSSADDAANTATSAAGEPVMEPGAVRTRTRDATAADDGAQQESPKRQKRQGCSPTRTSPASAATASATTTTNTGAAATTTATHCGGGRDGAATGSNPACVCGFDLIHMTARNRIIAFQKECNLPDEFLDLSMLPGRSPIMCDLCNMSVSGHDDVWSCENGRRTVLHSVAYDVCSKCFKYFALDIGTEPETLSEDTLVAIDGQAAAPFTAEELEGLSGWESESSNGESSYSAASLPSPVDSAGGTPHNQDVGHQEDASDSDAGSSPFLSDT